MPVSHIGLTVSHLPTSCSFFLSALQPLGYRFIGQQGNQVGLGTDNEADFFLCQESPGIKAGAAHIAFSATDRVAVRNFYTAALTAGARPHGSPATRDQESGVFNAAVLDFDGNSIEVVFRESDAGPDDTRSGVHEHSRVLTWRKSVGDGLDDAQSVVSGASAKSAGKTAMVPYSQGPRSVAPSGRTESVAASSQAPSMLRTTSAPAPKTSKEELNANLMGDAGARKIIGTLIGAAAGAAVAYAMVKSERDSAHEEAAAVAAYASSQRAPSQKAPSMAPSHGQQYQQSESAQMVRYERAPSHRNFSETESYYSTPHERRAIEDAPPRSQHAPTLVSAVQSGATTVKQGGRRNFSETESMYSSADSRDRYARALENAPNMAKSYLNPTCVSVAHTSNDVEYVPASSVGPRSTYSSKRSATAPSVISEMPKSSRAPSQAPSKAPSKSPSQAPSKSPSKSPSKAPSLISSFQPDDDSKSAAAERRSSAGSMRSHHSSKSKAPSLISSFVPERQEPEHPRDDYPPTPPMDRHSSAGSVHSHRSSKSKASTAKPGSKANSAIGSLLGRDRAARDGGDEPAGPFDDSDTVAPSDSISNAGSSRSAARNRSHAGSSGGGGLSVHSVHSSSSSKHSSHSKASSRRSSGSKHSSSSRKSGSSRRDEADGDVVRPSTVSEPSDASTVKPYKGGKERKDSVVSLPTKNLEANMAEHGPKRSVVSFAG